MKLQEEKKKENKLSYEKNDISERRRKLTIGSATNIR